jgi:hypothetical protein
MPVQQRLRPHREGPPRATRSTRLSAASSSRSPGVNCGLLTCRRRIDSSWRNTRISNSFERSPRRRPEFLHPTGRVAGGYSSAPRRSRASRARRRSAGGPNAGSPAPAVAPTPELPPTAAAVPADRPAVATSDAQVSDANGGASAESPDARSAMSVAGGQQRRQAMPDRPASAFVVRPGGAGSRARGGAPAAQGERMISASSRRAMHRGRARPRPSPGDLAMTLQVEARNVTHDSTVDLDDARRRGAVAPQPRAHRRLMTPAVQYCARIGGRKVHHSPRR